MRTPLPILALAFYATSAAAFVIEAFNCIEPEAHCCTMLASSGVGVNCNLTTLHDIYDLLAENTTNLDQYAISGGPQYASLCSQVSGLRRSISPVPACCKINSSSPTPDLETFDCIPPEEPLFRYNTETEYMRFSCDKNVEETDDTYLLDWTADDDYYE